MSNTLLTPTIIAREALMQLDNNLVMGNLVHRGYEGEFGTAVNGSKPGDTIRIRKPVQFALRTGAVADVQDVTEAYTSIQVATQVGVDFKFASSDMTLTIDQFSERYIKPAMIRIANKIDEDLLALYKDVYNWAGTAGQTINSYVDFAKGPERLDEMAVPVDGRRGVLSPADHWGLLGSFSGLYINDVAKKALERAKLPMTGGMDLYMSQIVQTHTVGAHGGTPLTRGANQGSSATQAVLSNWTQAFVTDGWTTSSLLKDGDVFTVSGVYAVNPVTKATLAHLQQFVLTADVTTNASAASATTLTISPPLITTGAYQTVSADCANDTTITYTGTASTGYKQNLLFDKGAFALAIVPMIRPAGAVDVVSESYKGISARMIPYYDGTNDVSNYRFDVLYGVKTIDPRLATRLSGTS